MAHHLRRRLLAGLAATSVLTGVLPPAASALSTTATPSPPPTASASPSTSAPASTAPSPDPTSLTFDLGTEPNVRITSVGEPLLKSGADLKVQAVISNPTKKPLPISSASLLGQDWVPDTRNGVLQFLDGGSTALSQLSVRDSVGSVPAEQSITVDFTIPRDELNWQDSFGEWGPRGVEIEVILEDGTDLTDRSFVVVAPGVDLTPMPTGVVIPITKDSAELSGYPSLSTLFESLQPGPPDATDASTPTPSDSPSDQEVPPEAATPTTAPEASADPSAQLLEGYQIPGVTAVVDPSYLSDPTVGEATGSAETNSSASFQLAVDSFVGQANTELIFTPMHDVDAQALVRGGAPGYLQSAQFASEDIAATQSRQPRTDISLLPADTDQRTVAALNSTGVTAVILPDTEIPQTEFRTATASARTDILLDVDAAGQPLDTNTEPYISALTVDSTTSSALAGALSSGDAEPGSGHRSDIVAQLDPLDSQQLVLALSAVTYLELPNDPRAMLLALDRAGLDTFGEGDADTANVQATLTALMAAPWVTPTTVSDMLKLEPTTIVREQLATTSSSKGGISHGQLTELDEAAATVTRYANLSSSPSTLTTPTYDAIWRAQSLAWRSDTSGRNGQVSDISRTAESMLSKLRVLPSSTINIISQATELPVHLSNSLPVPVDIVIQLDSYDNRLKQTNPVTVTLQARQSSTVSIPVEARGSGNIQTFIRILDSSGNEIGSAQTLEIRVRADWENLGTVIIAGFFGAILLFGVVKSLRRGKQHAPVDPAEFAKADRERRGGAPTPQKDDSDAVE